MSLSILAAGYFLSVEELKVMRGSEFAQVFALGSISLLLFWIAGAELALTFAGLWMLGALVGGYVATEAAWKLKRSFAKF